MMNPDNTPPPKRDLLYRNVSLLESVADYARRPAGEGVSPDIPGLTEHAKTFLAHWQGHAAAKLWLRLAQPTIDALHTYVDLDLTPVSTSPPADSDDPELKQALQASDIALSTLRERIEFQAQRWSPGAAA